MMMCFEKSACSVDNSDPVPLAPSCMPCMFSHMFKWCVSEDPACISTYWIFLWREVSSMRKNNLSSRHCFFTHLHKCSPILFFFCDPCWLWVCFHAALFAVVNASWMRHYYKLIELISNGIEWSDGSVRTSKW